MFLIFKILPDLLWPALLLLGILGFCLSYLPQAKPYHFVTKNVSLVVVAVAIFLCGMLYADNTWKDKARELQAKVVEAEAKSQAVNTVIQERIVNKIQVVKVRGEEITKYVDREIVKYDSQCVIPPEFVRAHNSAAEQPK